MRDIVLTALVFGSLPFIFRRPYIGVLVWSWLSYMNPHRLTWGFAWSMPFAQIVAITLLISLLTAKKEDIRLPPNGTIVLWFLLIFWMVFTTFFALVPEYAWEQLVKVLKIQFITFLTLLLINDYKKLNQLIWVIVISIGYYSVKGGIFTLKTGGAFRVWGPAGSFIEENNSLAVAILMIIPLMIYLYMLHRKNTWLRLGISAAIIFSTVSVFGSQSRGALIAIASVAIFLWLKTRAKLVSGIAILISAVLIFQFMPQSWHNRMDTIRNYQEDRSAMGRINAWQYSINVASARLTGGGFESWSPGTFGRWAPDPTNVRAAHSIYFSMLGDHGWPGLILFLIILFLTWRSLSRTIRVTNGLDEWRNQNLLARMLQISFVAYMSGGAFLSLTYFDLPWHLVIFAIILQDRVTASVSSGSGPRHSTDKSIRNNAAVENTAQI